MKQDKARTKSNVLNLFRFLRLSVVKGTSLETNIHHGWIYPLNLYHVCHDILFHLCCNFTNNSSPTSNFDYFIILFDLHAHWPKQAVVAQLSFGAGLNSNNALLFSNRLCALADFLLFV